MVKQLLTLFTVTLLLVSFSKVYGQQDPYYSHYMFNRLAYNPATAGSKDAICANLLTHNQWVGYDDQAGPIDPNSVNQSNQTFHGVAPKTYSANISGPINRINSAIGFHVVSDEIAYQQNMNFKFSYAYRLKFKNSSRNKVLAIGLDAGMIQKSLDGKKLNPKQPNDPKIPTDVVSTKPKFDLGAGAYYTIQLPFYSLPDLHDLYVGVSATHLTQPQVTYSASGQPTINSQEVLHYYLLAGADYDLPGSGLLVLSPSVLVKRNAVTQIDVTGLLTYNQQFRGGLSFRTLPKNSDALSVLLGYIPYQDDKKSFYIGYSYDLTLSRIRTSSSGTHEVFLNVCFKLPTHTPPEYLKRNTRHL